jgi:hypothetical protein
MALRSPTWKTLIRKRSAATLRAAVSQVRTTVRPPRPLPPKRADPGSGQQDGTKWNKSVPALHGIAIGDGVSAVTTLLGKELDSYLLEEESSQIHVYEYEGVSVGFSGKGAVHFVEVFGLDAATGLNGLKIGDKPEQAIKKLGQPEVQSEYHLKLDIDPGRNEIVSMKLIAAS